MRIWYILIPPYNSRQYCDAYHLLENVASWEKPEVFGVAKKMDRSNLNSKYCTHTASKQLEDLIILMLDIFWFHITIWELRVLVDCKLKSVMMIL